MTRFLLPLLLFCLALSAKASDAFQNDSLLRILATLPDDTAKVRVYNLLATNRENADSSLHYARLQLQLAQKLNDLPGAVKAHIILADTYFFLRNAARLEQSVQEGLEALQQLPENAPERTDEYFSLKLLESRLYRLQGLQERATETLLEAREYAAEVKNSNREAELTIERAMLFARMEQFNAAATEYRRAAELLEGAGDLNQLAHTRVTLAIVHYYEGEPEISEALLQQNLDLGDQIAITRRLYTQSTLANLLIDKGELSRAVELLETTIDGYQKLGDRRSELTVSLQLADALSVAGNDQEALGICQRVALGAAELNELQLQRDAVELSAQIHEARGDYRNANAALREAQALRTRWQGEELMAKTLEIEQRYNIERKEEEIAFLTQKNELAAVELERNTQVLQKRTFQLVALLLLIVIAGGLFWFIRRNQQLQHQKREIELEHRALRAQMNPHFIFNALNSIQRMYVEGDLDKANDFMADFSTLMRSILEQSEKRVIPLSRELETLRLYLELEQLRTRGKITFRIQCHPDVQASEVLVPPLIIQPFVENAIWHGILPTRRKGEVSVEIKKIGDKLQCTVSDDGIGIQQNQSVGSSSKGIAITEQRIGQRVQFSVPQPANQGTQVTFEIPTAL